MLYDKDIREPLAFYLEEIYGKNRILEEQVMGQSRADMKSATDISRDVSHQKKYPISDSQESQGVHVTFLRDLWITFPFLP